MKKGKEGQTTVRVGGTWMALALFLIVSSMQIKIETALDQSSQVFGSFESPETTTVNLAEVGSSKGSSINKGFQEIKQELLEESSVPMNLRLAEGSQISKVCSVVLEGGVCLGNQMNKYSEQRGLIGFWDFNHEINVDLAGSGSALLGDIKAGPGVEIDGSSAFFNGDNYLWTKHRPLLSSPQFSYSFWIYPIASSNSKNSHLYCPIVLKGHDDFKKRSFSRYPGIYVHEKTRRVRVYISLSSKSRFKDGIWTESLGRLPLSRWSQVVVTVSKSKLQIYINGILDSLQSTEGRTLVVNDEDLYIGGSPTFSHSCRLAFYLDQLQIYDHPLSIHAIQAGASRSLGGIPPNKVMIGCMDCGLEAAKKSCIKNYHLCTNVEMLTSGNAVAKIMGWNLENKKVWSDSVGGDSKGKGVAYCCRDYMA